MPGSVETTKHLRILRRSLPRSVVPRQGILRTQAHFPAASRTGHHFRGKFPRLARKLNCCDFAAALGQWPKLVRDQDRAMLRTYKRGHRIRSASADRAECRILLSVHAKYMPAVAAPFEFHVSDGSLDHRARLLGFPGSIDEDDAQRHRARQQQTQSRNTGLARWCENTDRSFSTRGSRGDIGRRRQDYSTIAIGPVHQ